MSDTPSAQGPISAHYAALVAAGQVKQDDAQAQAAVLIAFMPLYQTGGLLTAWA